LPIFVFFFYTHADHRALHSFPTRRSSDLRRHAQPSTDPQFPAAVVAHFHAGGAGPIRIEPDHSQPVPVDGSRTAIDGGMPTGMRSEEHTSELQSLAYLVCRLLLEKKKNLT